MSKKNHVVISIPAYDGVIPTQSAAALVGNAYLFSQKDWVMETNLLNNCSLVQKARNHLVHMFLEGPGTHMMCIDSDISWKSQDLMRLIAYSEKYPVVAAVYPAKDDSLPVYADFYYEGGEPKINQEGLVYARSIPAGFMLIRRDVLEHMAEKYKDYSYLSSDGAFAGKRVVMLFDTMLKNDKFYGEDVIFCQRLRECGYEIMVVPDIILGHHGNKTYSLRTQ